MLIKLHQQLAPPAGTNRYIDLMNTNLEDLKMCLKTLNLIFSHVNCGQSRSLLVGCNFGTSIFPCELLNTTHISYAHFADEPSEPPVIKVKSARKSTLKS